MNRTDTIWFGEWIIEHGIVESDKSFGKYWFNQQDGNPEKTMNEIFDIFKKEKLKKIKING